MTNIEKAKEQLDGCGITTSIDNNTLYVYIGDIMLELAEFEINFRANLYDTEQSEEKDE